MRDNNDRFLGAGIMVASGAGIAAVFGWIAAVFYIAGFVTAIVAAAIVVSSGMEDDWS